VQDDLRDGLRLGVEDVPAFFINGELFDKEPTLVNFKNYLDRLLDKRDGAVSRMKEKKRA
jgi:protein-disulfide isomerase